MYNDNKYRHVCTSEISYITHFFFYKQTEDHNQQDQKTTTTKQGAQLKTK